MSFATAYGTVGRATAWACLLPLATTGCSTKGLSAVLPIEVPDRTTLNTWEKIDGDVETSDTHAIYHFYVNPRRQALYEITHYRLTRIVRSGDGKLRRIMETEKLLWNPQRERGNREIQCFELSSPGRDAAGPAVWRRVTPGSPEYLAEMATGLLVYGLHRVAFERRGVPFRNKE